MPPIQPMLAKPIKGVPDAAAITKLDPAGLSFEPKWDVFFIY